MPHPKTLAAATAAVVLSLSLGACASSGHKASVPTTLKPPASTSTSTAAAPTTAPVTTAPSTTVAPTTVPVTSTTTVTAVSSTACSPHTLFLAAATSEHFNPADPSYAVMGAEGNNPGAYDLSCDGGWALAVISRPNIGVSQGETAFQVSGSHWIEVAKLGSASVADCDLTAVGIPEAVAVSLLPASEQSLAAGCVLNGQPAGFASANAQWTDSWASNVYAAIQGRYWEAALADLGQVGAADPGPHASTTEAMAKLQNLISLPETGATKVQQAEGSADISYLDAYFGTSGLGVNVTPQG